MASDMSKFNFMSNHFEINIHNFWNNNLSPTTHKRLVYIQIIPNIVTIYMWQTSLKSNNLTCIHWNPNNRITWQCQTFRIHVSPNTCPRVKIGRGTAEHSQPPKLRCLSDIEKTRGEKILFLLSVACKRVILPSEIANRLLLDKRLSLYCFKWKIILIWTMLLFGFFLLSHLPAKFNYLMHIPRPLKSHVLLQQEITSIR